MSFVTWDRPQKKRGGPASQKPKTPQTHLNITTGHRRTQHQAPKGKSSLQKVNLKNFLALLFFFFNVFCHLGPAPKKKGGSPASQKPKTPQTHRNITTHHRARQRLEIKRKSLFQKANLKNFLALLSFFSMSFVTSDRPKKKGARLLRS